MTPKDVYFGNDVNEKIKSGLNILADTVASTMGPRGRNVIIERTHGQLPVVTKDGVSVALEVFLDDPVENMGAQLIKDVASKTADLAGDGTTTATVLTRAMYNEGLKHITAGANPVELKRGMDKAVEAIVAKLSEESVQIVNNDLVKQVATISANGDEKIGSLIAEAMEAVGKDGIIDVEEALSLEDELNVVQGMKVQRGYTSPYFINSTNGNVEFDSPRVMIIDERLTHTQQIVQVLEQAADSKKPLLIIAHDFDSEVLSALAANNVRKILNVCAIKAPGLGTDIRKQLEDIALMANCKVYSSELGDNLNDINLLDLGTFDKVIVDRNETSFIGSSVSEETIKEYVDLLYKEKEQQQNDYMRDHIQKRIARITGGVAIIKVGAYSEVESKEKRDRIDDALCATRAAVEEGVVIGGGCSLLKIASKIENTLTGDEYTGAEIVRAATQKPLIQIIENAGKSTNIVDKVLEADKHVGYDAYNDVLVDMFEAGIIDPTKVERVALQQASSVAGLLLTSQASISFKKPEIK